MINGIHVYQGLCPDEVNGQYSRDPNCPCCKALMWLELYQSGMAVAPSNNACSGLEAGAAESGEESTSPASSH